MRYSNHVRAANGFFGWFGWLQTNSSKSPAFCKCGPTVAYTLPGIGIHISRRQYNEYIGNNVDLKQKAKNTLKHEYGHILQARLHGKLFFYGAIAPYSLLSAAIAKQHQCSWTETEANRLSKDLFCNTQNDCNWDTTNFPLNCN